MILPIVYGYAFVTLCCWRMFAGDFAWEGQEDRFYPQPDWKRGIIVGWICGALWPIALLVNYWPKGLRWPLVIGYERKRRQFEYKQALQKRQEAIVQAERELKIGQ